jgi:hypothetical protein
MIHQNTELRGIEFTFHDIADRQDEIQIRLVKQFSPVMSLTVPGNMDFFLSYDSLKIRETNVCGVFTIIVERIEKTDRKIIDSQRIFIEPPVPPYAYHDYSGILGSNYTSASSVNQIEFWSRFEELEHEIAPELAAAADIGINSLRVFLHEYVFRKDEKTMLDSMESFLTLCAKNKIRPLFVFFDDCWYGDEERVLDFHPISGSHNGRWAKCPLIPDRKFENYPRFEKYIKDIIGRFKDDQRIFGWEIWNEPKNYGLGNPVNTEFTEDLMMNGFLWARQANPVQPVVSCWDGNRFGDIDDQHNYAHQGALEYSNGVGAVVDMRRGTIVTEAGCRTWRNNGYGSPVHWIAWLEERRKKGLPNPGVYLNWELMAGNSNCTWHWSSKPGDRKPGVPWCGFFYHDLTPVNVAETAALRHYAGLQDNTILLNGFDSPDALPRLADSMFFVFTDGKLGELRHKREQTDRIVFEEKIEKGCWDVQVLFRLDDPVAKAGMEIITEKDGSCFLVLCSVSGIQITLKHMAFFIPREIPVNEMHNLKILCNTEKILKVLVDDFHEPVFTTGTEISSLKIALVASGMAAFDDLGSVYYDK